MRYVSRSRYGWRMLYQGCHCRYVGNWELKVFRDEDVWWWSADCKGVFYMSGRIKKLKMGKMMASRAMNSFIKTST